MTKYIIDENTLTNIANSVRAKTGSSASIPVNQLSAKIDSIPSGGGGLNEFKAPFHIGHIPSTGAFGIITFENPFSPENINKDWEMRFMISKGSTLTASAGSWLGFFKRMDSNAYYFCYNIKIINTSSAWSLSSNVNTMVMTGNASTTLISGEAELEAIYDTEFVLKKEGWDITLSNQGNILETRTIKDKKEGNDSQFMSFGVYGSSATGTTFTAKDTFELKNISFGYTT